MENNPELQNAAQQHRGQERKHETPHGPRTPRAPSPPYLGWSVRTQGRGICRCAMLGSLWAPANLAAQSHDHETSAPELPRHLPASQEGKPECLGRCLSPAALIALNCRGLDGLMEADGDQLSRGLPPRQPLRCIHFKYSLASLSVLFTKEPAAAGKGGWRRSWQRVKEGGSLATQHGQPSWPSPGVGGSQSQYNSALYMIYKAKHLSILFFVFIFLIISVMNDGSLYSKNNLQSIPTTSTDPPHSRMREIIPIFQVSKLRLRGNNWHHSCCSGLWAL